MKIFIDANVPIYAAGRPHPLRTPCVEILRLVLQRPERFVTDAEVLQELLHRYLSLRSWAQGRDVFQTFAQLMAGGVEAIHLEDVERGAGLADRNLGLSGRDLLHIAVMRRLGVHQIVSADRGFDRVPEIERLNPADFVAWREVALA